MAELFGENGVYLTKLSSERIQGWSCLKEWLKVTKEPDGTRRTFLHITRRCANLLRCLPLLLYDKNRPGDAATVPHEITHAPDALRGFAVFYTRPAEKASVAGRTVWTADMWEDYEAADAEARNYLLKKYGEPI